MQNDSLIERIARIQNVFPELVEKDLFKEFKETTEYPGIQEEFGFNEFLKKKLCGMTEVTGVPNYIFPPKEFKTSDNEMYIRIGSNDKDGNYQSFAIHLWRDSEEGNDFRYEMIQLGE